MFVSIDAATGDLSLEEALDFTSLKVVVAHGGAGEATEALGARLDGEHVWIPAATLRRLGPADAAWRESFQAMLTKVEPFGWIDPETGAVRAHVVAAG